MSDEVNEHREGATYGNQKSKNGVFLGKGKLA